MIPRCSGQPFWKGEPPVVDRAGWSLVGGEGAAILRSPKDFALGLESGLGEGKGGSLDLWG